VTPPLSKTGTRLYDSVEPLTRDDEANGWPLAYYSNAFAAMLDPVLTLVSEQDDGTPGYAWLFNPDTAPAGWLPYLEFFAGVTPYPAVDEAGRRLRIKETDGRRRGTPRAIKGAARQFLTGQGDVANLILNPSFEAGATGWSNSSSSGITGYSQTTSNTWSQTGAQSLFVTGTQPADSTLRGIGPATLTGTSGMPVVAGTTYTLSAYVRTFDPAQGAGTGYRMDISWFDAAGALLSTSTGSIIDEGAPGDVQRLTLSAAAPVGALFASVTVRILVNVSGDTAAFYLDAVQLEPGPGATAYVDGGSVGYMWGAAAGASASYVRLPVGSGYVVIIPRNGSPTRYTVVVRAAEIPASELTGVSWDSASGTWDTLGSVMPWQPTTLFDALAEQKPAGFTFDLIVAAGQIWDEVATTTWNTVSPAGRTWDELASTATI
jgi:hypothetical protein